MRRPGAGRSRELGEILAALDLRGDALEAPREHRDLLAHGRGRRRLTVGARQHRRIAVGDGELAERRDDRAQLRQPDLLDRALDGEGVRGGVDVLARAREVGELGDRVEPERRQPVAHEVLDGLHVVTGDGLLLGEPVDLGLPELEVQRPQARLVVVAERRRAEQRAVGERDQPLDLDLDAGAVEARLGEEVGERRDGGAIAAVERAERLRGERSHGAPVGVSESDERRRPGVTSPGGSRVRAAGRATGSHSRSYRAPRRTFPGRHSTGPARPACGRTASNVSSSAILSASDWLRAQPRRMRSWLRSSAIDEVAVGEVVVRELARAMLRAVVAAALEGFDRALVGGFADVPVAGAGAGRDHARTEARGIRELPEHHLRHRRPADVAGADEHDPEGRGSVASGHGLHSLPPRPSGPRSSGAARHGAASSPARVARRPSPDSAGCAAASARQRRSWGDADRDRLPDTAVRVRAGGARPRGAAAAPRVRPARATPRPRCAGSPPRRIGRLPPREPSSRSPSSSPRMSSRSVPSPTRCGPRSRRARARVALERTRGTADERRARHPRRRRDRRRHRDAARRRGGLRRPRRGARRARAARGLGSVDAVHRAGGRGMPPTRPSCSTGV